MAERDVEALAEIILAERLAVRELPNSYMSDAQLLEAMRPRAEAVLASDWLTAYVAAKQAEALREAADEAEGPSRDLRDVGTCLSIANDLRDRAAQTEARP